MWAMGKVGYLIRAPFWGPVVHSTLEVETKVEKCGVISLRIKWYGSKSKLKFIVEKPVNNNIYLNSSQESQEAGRRGTPIIYQKANIVSWILITLAILSQVAPAFFQLKAAPFYYFAVFISLEVCKSYIAVLLIQYISSSLGHEIKHNFAPFFFIWDLVVASRFSSSSQWEINTSCSKLLRSLQGETQPFDSLLFSRRVFVVSGRYLLIICQHCVTKSHPHLVIKL